MVRRGIVWRLALVVLLALAFGPGAEGQLRPAEPESGSGQQTKALATARRHMIVAAHPLAAAAGRDILRAGGGAVDAAIAAQLVLNLVEPQSSGLGGGAFLVHWDAVKGELKSYDARERAPLNARPDSFLQDGKPRPFGQIMASGLSVGVPGLVRGLELAHRQHGTLPWARLFAPAIELAENGFPVGVRLHALLTADKPATFSGAARAHFFDASQKPWPVGHVLRNPAFAATLKAIRDGGAAVFYRGAIAQAVVDAVRSAERGAGGMTLADLEAYEAKERAIVCAPYRAHRVCGMGPPSAGATAVGMTLQLLEPFDLGIHALNRQAAHLIVEAEKLAFADTDRWLADPDMVAVPAGLLDPVYLGERRRLMGVGRTSGRAAAGTPPLVRADAGEDATHEMAGTSHLSIVDARGNAVALTTTIEGAFGSRLYAAGFLLNNQLTDFSFQPRDAQGRDAVNRIEGGKRPRSSMAPTIVLDASGRLTAVLGSPGGRAIIPYTVKTLVGLIDWKLDAQQAAALTNFGSRNGPPDAPADVEAGARGTWLAFLLRWHGHSVTMVPMTSGVHVIRMVTDGSLRRLEGGADPRREGIALGD